MSLQCLYKLGVITYFQLHRDYIAEVLCINKDKPAIKCHGHCFLNKNLEMAEDASSDQEPRPTGKENVDFPVFLISESNYCFVPVDNDGTANCLHLTRKYSEYSTLPFHPPTMS
jgi:hypothetical protein